jgi:hypothetical protein
VLRVKGLEIRLSLLQSDQELVDAIFGVVHAINDADPALLEDHVRDAGERLGLALLGGGLSFEVDL